MDRNIVYPSSIPLDTDLLSINRNVMIALGFLTQAVLGSTTVADGLQCQPTSPASMNIVVGAGSITQFGPVDILDYGSIRADASDSIVKMGLNLGSTVLSVHAPLSVGQSVNYLVQASFQEADAVPVVLPYYNAGNPTQSFAGPSNSGAAQNTLRTQQVQLLVKSGVPGNTGSQITPTADSGWIGLYQITVSYGQLQVNSANITVIPSAPFLVWKLPALRPGFGSGVKTFLSSGTFMVPAGVTQVEVEVWGAGSGSYASVPGLPSGGGSAGGYARKLVTKDLLPAPGQPVLVTVGAGGAAGSTGGAAAGAGGASSFGQFVSASGGSLNYLATVAAPQNGATPAGIGVGGDVNFTGSAGQGAVWNQGGMGQGGMGGAAPIGGAQNSGSTGKDGTFPGGGAAGAGTGSAGTAAFNGALGGGGLVVVRW